MKKLIFAIIATVFLVGCTSSGAFLSANQTFVNLKEGNYSLTATNVSGEAEASYLFGMSYSTGFAANTVAVARVSGTGKLYAEALENLWTNYEKNNGMTSEHKLALVNVRYDSDILNLFLFTKVTISVRADIIEFY